METLNQEAMVLWILALARSLSSRTPVELPPAPKGLLEVLESVGETRRKIGRNP